MITNIYSVAFFLEVELRASVSLLKYLLPRRNGFALLFFAVVINQLNVVTDQSLALL